MRKNLFKGIAMGLLLMTSVGASAQINLGNLGKAIGQVVGSDLSSIISGKNNVTKETIAGTWSYSQPAVVFESSNLLKQAGGQIASATIEKKLAAQFSKIGIVAGKYLITFGSDGTFTTYKNGTASTSGKYTLSGSKITFSYLEGTANVSGYAQIDGDALTLTFDSSKLLGVIGKIGKLASGSSLSTITSLVSSFDGMKTGMAFGKYVAPAATTTAATTTATTTKATTTTKAAKKTTKASKKKTTTKKRKTTKK
jgi:hypothetical protein